MTLLLASLLASLSLLGCSGGKEGDDTAPIDSGDTDSGDTETGETDTAPPPVDEDRDGSYSDVDCNDNDYRIYPGAPEACDGIDNDCDQLTDEDFDADEDGHFDPKACKGGDDCDVTDGAVYPGAAEVPYDGIDQDCDGADLVDADGDNFNGRPAGGQDCDDNDAAVHPGADDTAFDGIDQDCDGADNIDGDGDGYGSADAGGDDCDDGDPAIHPGAFDWYNDGLDADCDGGDGGVVLLADDAVLVDGDDGIGDLAGYDVAACDLDEDGFDDLIVAAPFADSYAGRVGIWYGGATAAWPAGLTVAGADTVVTSTSLFLGFGIACGDVDGDGHPDLVAARGDIHYTSPYDTDFGLVMWYGDGTRWGAAVDESDGAAELTLAMGADSGVANVLAQPFHVVDLDGDGASELVVVHTMGDGYSGGDSLLHILPGARYSGTGDFDDEAGLVTVAMDSTNAVTLVDDGGDPDGDGVPDLLVGQGLYGYEATDSTDTAAYHYPGALAAVEWDAAATALAELSGTRLTGAEDLYFGWTAARGDLDGDGRDDLAVGAVGDAERTSFGGGLYFYSGYAALSGVVDGPGSADGHLAGGYANGFLGWAIESVGDANGDGYGDLLVSEPRGTASGVGRMYLLSGDLLATATTPDEAALLIWQGEDPYGSTGSALATGDFDGDGALDYVIPAYTFPTTDSRGNEVYTGRSYVILSSEHGG